MTDKNFYCNFYVLKADLKKLLIAHEIQLSEISTRGEEFEVWAYASKDEVESLRKSDLVRRFLFEDLDNSPFH